MDAELHNLMWAMMDLIVPALAAGILGLLKWLAPQIQSRVPGVMWPVVALALARAGTKICYAVNAPCEGNFVNWGDPEAYALAQGLAVIGVREVAVGIRKQTPKILEFIATVAARKAPA